MGRGNIDLGGEKGLGKLKCRREKRGGSREPLPVLSSHPGQVKTTDESRGVGRISKQWGGLLQEALTDVDTFGVQFPLDLDVKVKATLLGACFLIVSVGLCPFNPPPPIHGHHPHVPPLPGTNQPNHLRPIMTSTDSPTKAPTSLAPPPTIITPLTLRYRGMLGKMVLELPKMASEQLKMGAHWPGWLPASSRWVLLKSRASDRTNMAALWPRWHQNSPR